MINPLDPYWFNNRGLPTVFDQEIDYFTIISRFRDSLNDCITTINELETDVDSMSSEFETIKSDLLTVEAKLETMESTLKAYIDSQLDGVEDRLDDKFIALKAEIDSTISQLISDLDDFKNEITSDIVDFDTRLDQFNTLIITRFQELIRYIDSTESALRDLIQVEIDDLQTQIDNLVFELPDIYNPVEGANTSIQQAIIDLYGLHQDDAITAAEFDALEITARDFDLHAKSLLS